MTTLDEALETARQRGFNDGMQHGVETLRDNPDARQIACAIVEDWVRDLSAPYQWGLDISFRKRELNEVRPNIGVWDAEGRIEKQPTLFEALEALAHRNTTKTPEPEEGD